jgi:hypothetical protein
MPLIGRLFWFEYLALFASLILVLLEWVIHFITFLLRKYTEEAPRVSVFTASNCNSRHVEDKGLI